MKKYIGIIAIGLLIIAGCKKEQKLSDKLTGLWTVTEYTEGGDSASFGIFSTDTAGDLSGPLSYQFRSCETKVDSVPCGGFITGTYLNPATGNATGLTYYFSYTTDGKKALDMTFAFPNDSGTVNATINNLSKKSMELQFDNDGTDTKVIMEKANV